MNHYLFWMILFSKIRFFRKYFLCTNTGIYRKFIVLFKFSSNPYLPTTLTTLHVWKFYFAGPARTYRNLLLGICENNNDAGQIQGFENISNFSQFYRNCRIRNFPHSSAFHVRYLFWNFSQFAGRRYSNEADSQKIKFVHKLHVLFNGFHILILSEQEGEMEGGVSGLNEFPRKRVESIKHGAGGRLIEISSKSWRRDSRTWGRVPRCGEHSLRRRIVTRKC